MPVLRWADNAPTAAGNWNRSTDGLTRVIQALAGSTYVWLDERDGLQMLMLDALTVRRSTDGGDIWSANFAAPLPRTHHSSCLRIRATGTILVGLIQADFVGPQLARTTDGGASWSTVTVEGTVAGSSRLHATTFIECEDGSILCHRDPNAGLHDHVRVYRSTDDGATWATVLDPAEAFSGTLGSLVYVRGRAFLTTGDGVHNLIVHRSINEGVAWTAVLDAGTDRLFDTGSPFRVALCLRPDGTRMYLYTRADPGGLSKRYFSIDNGASWTFEADPVSEGNVFGVNATAGAMWRLRDPTTGPRIWRSIDNGASWADDGTIKTPNGTFATHQYITPAIVGGPSPVDLLMGDTLPDAR